MNWYISTQELKAIGSCCCRITIFWIKVAQKYFKWFTFEIENNIINIESKKSLEKNDMENTLLF